MASSNCLRSLARPTSQLSSPLVVRLAAPSAAAAFSTTSTRSMPPPKLSAKQMNTKTKGSKTLRIKKKAFVKTGKPPAVGERKALRKRIIVSNTNALEVIGMRDLDTQMVEEMSAVQPEEAQTVQSLLPVSATGRPGHALVGKVVGLQGATVDSLRAVDAFKTTQGWGIFRRPGVLVREENVVLTRKLVDAQAKKETVRLVIDGEKGTGKSLMMLHAMSTAFVKGWIVLNIPEAQEVTNAMTDYAAVPGTTPTLWSQNSYIVNWLTQIGKANSAILEKLKVLKEHNLPVETKGVTLARLCELGARDPDVAWPFFQALWSEITANGRPPVMMCLDSLSFIMQNSLYRAPDFSLIHSHDLAVLRHFTDHLSGTAVLPNGGAILAATNRSHAPLSKSLSLSIKQAEERQAGQPVTPKDPFEKGYDVRAERAMSGVEVMRLKGLSKREARGLMEYWAQSGVLRCKVDEETVAEKWALAGNGVVGEIQRAALWMRI